MSDLFEVEAILLSRPASIKSRQRKGQLRVDKQNMDEKEYFIKWKGYSILESTWEPYSNLANVKALVAEFCNHDEKLLAKLPHYKEMILKPQFACEALTDKRKMGDKWEYLVKWKDFQQETWEAAENLPKEALDRYNDSYNEDNDALLSESALDHATSHHHHRHHQDNDFGGADDFHANDDEQQEQKFADREASPPSRTSSKSPPQKPQQQQKQESSTNGTSSNKRRLDESAMLEENDEERTPQKKSKLASESSAATTTSTTSTTTQQQPSFGYPAIPSNIHLTGQEEVEVAMLRKFERQVVKVIKDGDGSLCVRTTSAEGKDEKFSLNAFKAVYPHHLVDYFLKIIKFGSNKN